MRVASLIVLVAACTDSSLGAPTGEIHDYTLTGQTLPTTVTHAKELGVSFDVNGDTAVLNQLGSVFASLYTRSLDPGATSGEQIAAGDLTLAPQLQFAAPDATDEALGFAMVPSEHEQLLVTDFEKPLLFGPGTIDVELAVFDEVVPLELVGAQVRLTRLDREGIAGVIGGGVRTSDVEALMPPFVRHVVAMIDRECTRVPTNESPCGCAITVNEYDARYWVALFDTIPRDCTITVDEVRTNTLIRSLLTPDTVVDGAQVLSFGYAFEASAR